MNVFSAVKETKNVVFKCQILFLVFVFINNKNKYFL